MIEWLIKYKIHIFKQLTLQQKTKHQKTKQHIAYCIQTMSSLQKQKIQVSQISSIQIKNIQQVIHLRSQCSKYLKPIGLADIVVYHYTKQASFFGKKQQRIIFTFVSGLNTNPQNLSIFLRDLVSSYSSQSHNSKQKLSKGQFFIYDIFNENDCVVEISIPGNFQIYKIKNGKKQLISNYEIDCMYVSSILRSMYEKNIVWGKCYNLFGYKNIQEQYKVFINVFLKIIQKNDFLISDDYENKTTIKGSHSCTILFQYIKNKNITHQTIDILQKQIQSRNGYTNCFPKMLILLAQLYSYDGKYAKSLNIIAGMMGRYCNDPFLLFYQAKYMFQLMAVHEALTITNSIVQFNQFEIWCLAAQLHIELKSYSEALVCLNHASKIAAKNTKALTKNTDIQSIYAEFEKLGKKNLLTAQDQISQRPKLMTISENPLSIAGNVQEKYKSVVENQFWKMGYGSKVVYLLLRTLRYRLDTKKFQQLLQNTFEQSKKQHPIVNFRAGLTQSMFIQTKTELNTLREAQTTRNEDQLPQFLKDQSIQIQAEQVIKGNRNLSIIPQLQSVIQNSQFEQKQKQPHKMAPVKHKKQLNEHFFKILKSVLSQGEIEKAQFEQNWAKVLPVFNKLRNSSKLNSFYTHKMFEIMIKIQNYKSVLVLIAQSLDAYEQLGSKKIETLPFWMQKYVFEIIEEKGLKFLNGLLQKMNFFDEAVIDTIQLAKQWKIKGCTF